ncbi:prolipoprotein diacylglyceryl transferase [Mycolicibacterium elephantis]|uniref:prolipoprotein diacylglyceryl transferase n=1 Tax=Mycolicibacterium elephantis TaxID=81858 RepID=UPI0007EA4BB1|nr:prolipoprotein diacylglyceryl transferase [Mycolicibacterium elephantis]OBE97851.1 prolipoprotein diacylglyceryl transferase [Mycolicibacterium elephantis]
MTTTVLAAIPSPSQGVWQLGPVPLRAYALFIILGIVAALMIGDRRWEARGGERGVIYDIALWAVPFGLIGGRLYHVMTDWWRYFGEGGAGLAGVVRIWDGGLGIWGAVALGGLGAWIGCRRRGIPLPAFGDAIAPGIILAQGIGRIGNYFNQELYGRDTTLPWGLKIYERRTPDGLVDNLNGVSTGEVLQIVHPTFLYELLWNLLVFAALIYLDRRFKLGHGRLFAMYVAGYCVGRFWIELLRVDDATLIDGVRINSFTSTFVFIGAVVYIMVAPKGREDPATLKGKQAAVSGEDLTEELAAVGATAGVVAAAKVAAEKADDESKSEAEIEAEALTADVLTAPSEDIVEAEEFAEAGEEAEIAAEAEKLGADVAGVPADDLAEAEEFATEGEPAAPAESDGESEAAEEAEALADDVEEASAEDIAEAQEFAEAKEDAEPEAGVGAVEGEEAEEAQAAAAEAHEAAVEGLEEAEEASAEVHEEAETEAEEGEDLGAELDEAADAMAEEAAETAGDQPEAGVEAEEAEEVSAEVDDDTDAAESEGEQPETGVGAVEGEDAEEAQAAAAEAHESAVEGLEEAEEVAAEVDEDTEQDEADETDREESTPSPPGQAEAGGRLRRWMRRRRNR